MITKAWWTTRRRFIAVAVVATLLSVGGILIAALWSKDAGDGGRGGALAVALSFLVLFLSRAYGSQAYTILTEGASDLENALTQLRDDRAGKSKPAYEAKVDALVTKADIEATAQSTQNRYLAFSSVVGTIAWGFGDTAAGWFL